MKNRTDRMLLRSFLVSLLAYGLLLFVYIQCFWSGTITAPILDALERPFFWLAVGYWESVGEIRKQWQAEHIFEPAADRTQIAKAVAGWEDAVRQVLREKND